MASPNISTEAGTGWAVEEASPDYADVSFQFEDGASQGYYTSTKKLRTWNLTAPNLPSATYLLVEAFVDARRGSYQICYFNDPLSGVGDIPVRIVKDSYKVSPQAGGPIRSVTLRLREDA